jgi:hypothetical protein
MTARTTRMEVRAIHATREHVADLIARYPKTSAEDSKLILDFLRTGRHLDVGLLTADEKLKPKLDAFMHDHKAHFRLKAGEGLAVVGTIAGLFILFWLLWELLP